MLESRTTYQPHYVQMADGSLLINPVQFEDRGKYVCQSSNGEGPGAEISAEVRLRVTKMEEVCGRQSQGVVSGSGSGHIDVGGEEDHRRRRRRRRRKRVAYGEVVTGAHEWPWQVQCVCVWVGDSVCVVCGGGGGVQCSVYAYMCCVGDELDQYLNTRSCTMYC